MDQNQEVQIFRILITLLDRVQLKGNEVDAFNVARKYLIEKIQAAEANMPVPDPTPEPQDGASELPH